VRGSDLAVADRPPDVSACFAGGVEELQQPRSGVDRAAVGDAVQELRLGGRQVGQNGVAVARLRAN
jgi:hypothetical protein